MWQTARDSEVSDEADDLPIPGVIVVWSGDEPTLMPFRLPPPGLVIGRELLGAQSTDDRISRQHARLRWTGASFSVADLGSRNGTYAGGQALVDGEITVTPPAVLRTGRTVSVLVADVRPYERRAVDVAGEAVVGPTLADAWAQVERAARSGETLMLTGESGSGKELAARHFHVSSGATGELVAVNCAAIPAGVAERLLFGARKGAYSGADRDADGYLSAADGGTIFLDEIADLDLQVQSKLLRVIETGELLALGAARPRPIKIKIVTATLRDLKAEVVAGRFRDDLYYRIGRPEVRLPALRQRPEDVPWLVARAVQQAAPELAVHSTLIEVCLLRPWPGNVRELLGEVRRAAYAARDAGKKAVRGEDLDGSAGMILDNTLGGGGGDAQTGQTMAPDRPSQRKAPAPLPDTDTIATALREEGGNVTRAARRLGLHRNQLRRFLTRHPELASLATGKDDPDGTDGGGDS
jgi:transcriptional regulator with GAF, ATPase, and Fis domain